MDFSTATLGRGIVAQLQERRTAAIVTVGRDRYTRGDLAAVQCFNFSAARQLNAAIAALRPPVASTRDLFQRIEPAAFALPGIGAFTFAVLGAIFESAGVGTLDQWEARALDRGARLVTFATLKQRIHRQTTRTVRRPRPQRKRAAPPPAP